MFRQVFPFVIFNIRNFNRMNVKLACVNYWISNSKYFSYKAKGSYCNSIDLLKLIIWKAEFIKPFDVNAEIRPDSCFENLTGDIRKRFWFLNRFWTSTKIQSSSFIFISLNDELKIYQLPNGNEDLEHNHWKTYGKPFLFFFWNAYWWSAIQI